MIPKGRLNVTNKQDKERVLKLIKDLVFTLNSFWKSNKIPFRVREPRKSDMNRFKQKNKDFKMSKYTFQQIKKSRVKRL